MLWSDNFHLPQDSFRALYKLLIC